MGYRAARAAAQTSTMKQAEAAPRRHRHKRQTGKSQSTEQAGTGQSTEQAGAGQFTEQTMTNPPTEQTGTKQITAETILRDNKLNK